MKKPLVELSDCIACGVCAEVSPNVFRLNDAGYIEITESEAYPEEEVNDVVVVLQEPALDGDQMSYQVEILDGEMPAGGGQQKPLAQKVKVQKIIKKKFVVNPASSYLMGKPKPVSET